VTNLTPATGYEVSLAHQAAPNSNLSTDHELTQYRATNPTWYMTQRHHYPSPYREHLEKELQIAFSRSYTTYPYNSTKTTPYIVTVGGDRWLFVDIPDAVWFAFPTGIPTLAGEVTVSLTELPKTMLTFGTAQVITVEEDYPVICTASITPNHHYRIQMTFANYTTSLPWMIDIMNSTGYNAYPQFVSPGQQPGVFDNTIYATGQASFGAEIILYFWPYGEGPLEILITDITYTGIVLEGFLMVAGGLGGTLIIGILIGYIFGRRRRKK
jgi:hypothetical protein